MRENSGYGRRQESSYTKMEICHTASLTDERWNCLIQQWRPYDEKQGRHRPNSR